MPNSAPAEFLSVPVFAEELTVHIRSEIISHVERLCARFRLGCDYVRRFETGYTLDLHASRKYWPVPPDAENHHLLLVSTAGEYGTQIVANCQLATRFGTIPSGAFLAVTDWRNLWRASQHLR